MAGTFQERTELLAEMVGDGDLEGTFLVNGGERTIPLEVGYWRNYMGTEGFKEIRNYNDGQSHFVGSAIAENHIGYLNELADMVLEGAVRETMIGCMQDMNRELQERAPIRTGSLRESGAEIVTDEGRVIHEYFGPSFGEEPPSRERTE